jgi:hypothetical protein
MMLTFSRMKNNWKWLVIVTVLIVVTLIFILGLAFACRHNGTTPKPRGGAIPLQILASRPSRRSSQEDSPSSLHNLPRTSVSSPLGQQGLGPSLRLWAREEKEREEAAAKRQLAMEVITQAWSPDDTETIR